MAGADVIGTAICVALLVIVAYVVAGSILTTTGVVINTQSDMNRQIGARLNTAIQVNTTPGPTFNQYDWSPNRWYIHFHIINTGNEVISNFNSTDVYLATSTNAPVQYKFDGAAQDATFGGRCGDANSRTWNYYDIFPDDNMNPGMLDPGEELSIDICNFNSIPDHFLVGATTPNGVSAFYTV